MLNRKENIQNELILYTMEDLVPEDSLFRNKEIQQLESINSNIIKNRTATYVQKPV